jgi:hypothetical protein
MKNKNKREPVLYPQVAQWVRKHFLCSKTAINKGLRYSKVDIIGVRDVGGELSGEVQTIAIEVKREGSPFATTTGQTLGYSVYANWVYLAEEREEPFTIDERDIASHLGVGLIQIIGSKCNEILSSPFHTPIGRLNLRLLEQLGIGQCQFCDSFFEMGDTDNHWSRLMRGEEPYEVIVEARESKKGIMFWNMEVAERKRKIHLTDVEKGASKERRFICPECLAGLFTIDSGRLDSWFRKYGRGVLREILNKEHTALHH